MVFRVHTRIFLLTALVCALIQGAMLVLSLWFALPCKSVLISFLLFLILLYGVLYFTLRPVFDQISRAYTTKELSPLKRLKKSGKEFELIAHLTQQSIVQEQELKNLKKGLQDSERNTIEALKGYLSLLETVAHAMIMVNNDGSIVRFNKKALLLLHKSPEDLKNLGNIFTFFSEREQHSLKNLFKETSTTGQRKAITCPMLRGDNQIFHAEISISASEDNHRLFISIEDITERKKTEQEKQKLEEQFRTVYKMEAIGQLAGGIAHDFNNILGAISGYADIIRHKYSSDEKLDKYAQMILSAANRASELTNKLLTFARKSKCAMIPFDVNAVLKDVAELLQHTLDKKITVLCDLQSCESIISGDPAQFKSALMNLALNARDAMPHGGELHLKTVNTIIDKDFAQKHAYTILPGSYVTVSVSDTGCGMDKKTLGHLFEPFFTTKDIGKGTGLGLASVYGTIKSHHGYIDVDSSPDKGSAFTIYFPVASIDSRNSTDAPKAFKRGKGHILVVDDESFMRDALREMLSWLGYSVSICSNGEEAIDLFKSDSDQIDLIILDMMMPGMNGRDCFRQLKEIRNSVRVLLSTGYRMDEERQQLIEEGIVGIIQKPFVSAQLAQAVHNAL